VGSCVLTARQLAVGKHALNAEYAGDAVTDQSSTGPDTSLTVTKALGKVSLRLTHPSVTYGKEGKETLSVTVASSPAGTPVTGKVTFKAGFQPLCTATLTAKGTATCHLYGQELTAGRHKLTATYSGNGSVAAGKASRTVVVTKKKHKK
jgi:hypothetical protein